MKSISLGFSPCPNDTFIFYALIHGKVNTGGLTFNEFLLDVETLNEKAQNCRLDVTKVSCAAFGHLRKDYCMLRTGGALGRGCGPLVVTREDCPMEDLYRKKIAIPGKLTTAHLLLQLYFSSFGRQPSDLVTMPFHQIMEAVAQGRVDAGLIIHESRFTYPSYGLTSLVDLGDWWEKQTGLPIPLGSIIARRSLGREFIACVNSAIEESVHYAFANREEPMEYIRKHSQELSEDVIRQHINLYVNDFSLDLGESGEKAVHTLLAKAEEAGLIPDYRGPLFYD